MADNKKYKLSFTAASLRLNEMIRLADYMLTNEIDDISQVKDKGSIITNASARTTDREFREVKNRVKLLTKPQLQILSYSDLISQKQIGFIAVCKVYNFIRDFTVEIIRDKVLGFDYVINDGDINTFINRKMDLHPELEGFSESTLKKAKQVMFHILEQAGIIDNPKQKNIQPQLIGDDVLQAVVSDNPEWLKVLLMSDMDIKQISKQHGEHK